MSLAEIWDRLWVDVTTPVDVAQSTVLIALAVVVACIVVAPLWGIVRHAVTIAHEGGHALVAGLTGRRVSGIRLHSDTSGLTTSYGEAKRFPLTLVALAGYPAPGVLGLAAAWAIAAGHAVAVLWVLEAVLLLMLVRIRNWYGLLVMVVAIAGLGAAAWLLPDPWRVGLACGLAWLLMIGAVRAVVELGSSRRGGRGRGSDADALARLTTVPGGAWVAVFWLLTAGCAGLGGWWLLAS
ncbi:M50 family metallopeptidase [Demequina sp. SYSU T00068]|uniref:M50 family metallopeptidase n=1 Tax=Demequina lignilytica TaxID=3051663 RepID=UPI002628B3E7|nr:M50 family metallopeptidase [Demequina sp. SYSU T00068]MDN4490385.1 M50 family metallopeptidase [Demequina sp. SYSU T00068]